MCAWVYVVSPEGNRWQASKLWVGPRTEREREWESVSLSRFFWILLTQVKFTSCDSRFVWALFPGQPVTSGRDTNDEHILSPDPRFRLYTLIFVWPLDLCMYIYKYYAAIHCFVHWSSCVCRCDVCVCVCLCGVYVCIYMCVLYHVCIFVQIPFFCTS